MRFEFYDCDDRLMDSDSVSIRKRNNWRGGELNISVARDIFSVRLEEADGLVDEDIVCDEALKLLTRQNPLSVEYKGSDEDWTKRLHRLVAASNGDVLAGRLRKDDSHDFFRRLTKMLCHYCNAVVGAGFCRGLSMPSQEIMKILKEQVYKREDDNCYEGILTDILCNAPSIIFEVSYRDNDICETVKDSIDVAVLSFSTALVDDDEKDSDGEICFTLKPVCIRLEKEKFKAYFIYYLDKLVEKHLEVGGYHFQDTVLRTALVENTWAKFKDWVEGKNHHGECYYEFDTQSTTA